MEVGGGGREWIEAEARLEFSPPGSTLWRKKKVFSYKPLWKKGVEKSWETQGFTGGDWEGGKEEEKFACARQKVSYGSFECVGRRNGGWNGGRNDTFIMSRRLFSSPSQPSISPSHMHSARKYPQKGEKEPRHKLFFLFSLARPTAAEPTFDIWHVSLCQNIRFE